jgi:hypothetical protein
MWSHFPFMLIIFTFSVYVKRSNFLFMWINFKFSVYVILTHTSSHLLLVPSTWCFSGTLFVNLLWKHIAAWVIWATSLVAFWSAKSTELLACAPSIHSAVTLHWQRGFIFDSLVAFQEAMHSVHNARYSLTADSGTPYHDSSISFLFFRISWACEICPCEVVIMSKTVSKVATRLLSLNKLAPSTGLRRRYFRNALWIAGVRDAGGIPG